MKILYSLGNSREWTADAAVGAATVAVSIAVTRQTFKVLMSGLTSHRVTGVVNTVLPIDACTITQNNLHARWQWKVVAVVTIIVSCRWWATRKGRYLRKPCHVMRLGEYV
jgi:mannose/fructose/N-acetylgalactosamine-specific phosphotransferase system component IIC